MNMKHILLAIAIFTLNNSIVFACDTHNVLDDLVAVRIAWAGQENNIVQLKYEASNIARSRVVEYVYGGSHIATIDANDSTIITHLDGGRAVKLSYQTFSLLLSDQRILDLANKQLQAEQEREPDKQNVCCCKLIVWITNKLKF